MTLVRRVSCFFLGALAIASACYSATFYYFARTYLREQFDARLRGAMEILSASVEVEPDDAKWQPQEHGINPNHDLLADARWVVTDERDQVIDHSPNLSRDDPGVAPLLEYAQRHRPDAGTSAEIGDWRILQRQLDATEPKPMAEREPHDFASIRITVARSPRDLNTALHRFAVMVVVLPAAVCLLAIGLGRSFVKRALQPVRAMAASARSMGQADLGQRLPVGRAADELTDLGREFNSLLDRLQNGYERQRRFTSDAAHQLRTPLAVLQGQIDVLRRRERTVEEYAKTLAVLGEQTAELSRIVESLLFLARAEEGAPPPQTEPLHLNAWLTEYCERWSRHPRAHDFSLQLAEDVRIHSVPALLSQLLDNLIHNAFKYSRPGTPVRLRTTRQGAGICLLLEDRGIGIPPDDQAFVFDPFFRSATARQAGITGTGLGLAIAARIAVALRGELKCSSNPDVGTTFSFVLPHSDLRT